MSEQPSLGIIVSQQAGWADADGAVGEKAKEALETLGTLLSDAVGPLRQKLTDTAASADEIEIALNLAFKGGGNWLLISMEGGATVSVKLVWRNKPT